MKLQAVRRIIGSMSSWFDVPKANRLTQTTGIPRRVLRRRVNNNIWRGSMSCTGCKNFESFHAVISCVLRSGALDNGHAHIKKSTEVSCLNSPWSCLPLVGEFTIMRMCQILCAAVAHLSPAQTCASFAHSDTKWRLRHKTMVPRD